MKHNKAWGREMTLLVNTYRVNKRTDHGLRSPAPMQKAGCMVMQIYNHNIGRRIQVDSPSLLVSRYSQLENLAFSERSCLKN